MSQLKGKSGIEWGYEVKGEGETIVFFHGWACSRNVWRQQIEYFSRSFKVIAIDWPGHGESSWKHISLTEMAEDIQGLLEELKVKEINIVASSMGGLLAIELFSLNPSLVKKLVLVGSLPKFAQAPDYPHGLQVIQIRELSRQLDANYPEIVRVFFRSLFSGHERRSERYQWLQQFASQEQIPEQGALKKLLEFLIHEDLREDFRRIPGPVLFMNGTEDYICSADSARTFSEAIPDGRLELFEHCGHFPFLTEPVKFNQAVENFLAHA